MAVAGMFTVPQTIGSVLCCKCGISMQPNVANMCANCLCSEVDITEGLQKHVIIRYCPQCECYLQPPRSWIKAPLESKELLTFCVKRLTNLNAVHLVHAEFIWTEPHSKRIKIKLRVQKEVLHGAILEQAYTIEFVVQYLHCDSCAKVHANQDQWVAVVQLRQNVSHSRTFFYLEQLILKHNAASDAIRIKQMDQGVDFFFGNKSHAQKFAEFIGKVAPVIRRDEGNHKLVSHDTKSNVSNLKYAISVEINPVCREDLICLPPRVAASLGYLGPLVICHKVSSNISLLDPLTLRQCCLDAEKHQRLSLQPLLSSRLLIEYIVLDLEPISSEVISTYTLADAHVARVSDFGKNDRYFTVRTHLGNLLSPEDYALGYDLYGSNSNDMELDKYKSRMNIPDVILIKKSYEEKRQMRQRKSRPWKFKSLKMEVDEGAKEKINVEYQQFLRDIEENPDLRFNLSLYRNKEHRPSPSEMADAEGVPSVPLEELLADLDLDDEESYDHMVE
ncbi:unnamed protein product [Cuscuta epithymum]|uniref:60S ribosomal export protein NMD3 n=1 Tax=Cuscuta epithymum TaxID=186058 RepID=A0AAV0DZD2_9ASTE|nr:unnamed protein product [Cuscuta epithymum]